MANRALTPPVISIDTTMTSDQEYDSERSRPNIQREEPGMILSPTAQNSLLSPIPTFPTSPSLSGETLRSRSGSFQSTSDFTARTRSSSINTAVARSEWDDLDVEDTLRPDPGNEADFVVENNPFAFSPGQLNKLLNPKSLAAFRVLGGLQGLEKGLRTDLDAGLSVDESQLIGNVSFDQVRAKGDGKAGVTNLHDIAITKTEEGKFHDRLRVFKDNRLPERKPDSIWKMIWRNYNDKILILLTLAAIVSLAIGIYEAISGTSSVDWVEGVAIVVAIVIVVMVGAANDWQKERQFIKLNQRVSLIFHAHDQY